MTLTCMIIDDEPVARKLLQEYIGDTGFLEWKGSAENALKAGSMLASTPVDLLFLDINMPRLTGLEFLRTLKAPPMVILTTAYAEYAATGFELDVLDYLIKPFSFERFLKACNKARDYHQLKYPATPPANPAVLPLPVPPAVPDYCFVKRDGRIEKVFFQDLIHIEAMLNYVVLHTVQGKMIVYHTIKGMLEQLPPDLFLRVHKSSIVNLSKVRSIEGNVLDLGTHKVTISQGSHDAVLKAILRDRMIRR